MRNAMRPPGRDGKAAGRMIQRLALVLAGLAVVFTAGGCASARDGEAANVRRSELATGFAALEQQRYDEAIAAGDRVLAADSTGPGSAEALYLQGQAFEKKAKDATTPSEAREHLRAARGVYARALSSSPAQPLEAYARAGLANASYFLEDFGTAAREWEAAAPQVNDPDAKAWVLYRAGLSRQRTGSFAEADRLFAQVRQHFPGTEQARRASTHMGATAFHVQLGAFADRANADRAIGLLKAQGYSPARAADASGKQIVAVGPLETYGQAKAIKDRLASQYPDAKIVP
jgi:outer membrane protein assembly factor BamD (BamD/ComL family)